MKININGKDLEFKQGETILNVAKRNGIEVPSLCYDERFKPSTSCFICIVKDKNSGRLIPSCSVQATAGINIITNDEEITKYRKMALELLLSEHDADCFSPCKTACPAGIDVRDYILYNRTGEELKGFMAVRKKNPLVSVIGRVCPAFCEDDCSRNHIDETVNIRLLKKYLGDAVYEKYDSELFETEKNLIKKVASPKKIAIIGGGPAGLSASYYLALAGHKVTIHESQPELGGLLRYAIPTYRLPTDVLNKEIESITRLGINVVLNSKIDKDKLQKLSKENDTVLVSIGTWKETPLGLNEGAFVNVMPAVSFLKNVVDKKTKSVGNKVIVIGGGNSAIDAARVALRLGAKEVNLLYRRTRKEMPALDIEIEDALQEGVKLFELMSPFELLSSDVNGFAKSIKFRKMVLSDELDNSGRRKIKDTDDFKTLEMDTLIYAIGQKPEPELLEALQTLKNVYVCGDASNGASTVIEAVADGRKTAGKIINTLSDELAFYSLREKSVLVSKDNKEIQREKVSHLDPKSRINNFKEVENGYIGKVSVDEAKRCINCGCSAIEDCDLRKYSIDYNAEPLRFKHVSEKGKKVVSGAEHAFLDGSLNYMVHEPSKCIKCGKCINVCNDVAGAGAISFINRGLNVVLSSNTENNISKSTCITCGMCIDSCPTGSLAEKTDEFKWSNLDEKVSDCKGCILKCKIKYGYSDGKVFRTRSFDTPICTIGRWGWVDDYKDITQYYKGTVSKTKIKIDESRLVDPNDLDGCDYVLSLNYLPQADNPRMVYEFARFKNRSVIIKHIKTKEKLSELSGYKNPVLVLNYLNCAQDILDFFTQEYPQLKVLPIYYR